MQHLSHRNDLPYIAPTSYLRPSFQPRNCLPTLKLLLLLFAISALVHTAGVEVSASIPAPATTPRPSPSPTASATPTPTPPTSPQVDRSFGIDGRQEVVFPHDTQGGYEERDIARDVVVQPDGKIVVVGDARTVFTNNVFGIARLNPDGSHDSSFDGDGQKFVPVGGSNDIAFSVALQPDGKIVAAGQAYAGSGFTYDFAVVRLNPDGSLDSTFGDGGKVTTDFGKDDIGSKVLIQPDGKIVVIGYSINDRFALARYLPDGSLDPTFGTGGKVLTSYGEPRFLAFSGLLLPDGKILAVGDIAGTRNSDFALVRYNPDGTVDQTFGASGLVTTDFGRDFGDYGFSSALQPDGKIVVGGWAESTCPACYPVGDSSTALARYLPDGQLDTTFGSGGRVIFDVSRNGSFDKANDLVIQQNGKIVVVDSAPGHFVPYGSHFDFAITRFLNDGQLDNGFGDDGVVTVDFGIFYPPGPPQYGSYITGDGAYGVALQPDGKIVAAGYLAPGRARRHFAITRLHGDPVTQSTPEVTIRVNHALSTRNATVIASSQYSSSFPVSAAINGDRRSLYLADGRYNMWHSAHGVQKPDWLEVTFAAPKVIDEIDIFTQQDDYLSNTEPTEAMLFTQYGLRDIEVQYWADTGWATIPNGSITNNAHVWRKFNFSPVTTSKIRVLVRATADGYSRVWEIEAWGNIAATPPPPPQGRINAALASNGGVAIASSQYNGSFPVAAAINGDRYHLTQVDGSYNLWHSAAGAQKPDWLQVDFNGSKTINEINVVTLQDDHHHPVNPTEETTFTLYGLTSFQVQYWDGAAWVTLLGGSVTDNDRVLRKFTFPAVTTSKIRVLMHASKDSYSRIMEVEAWTQ